MNSTAPEETLLQISVGKLITPAMILEVISLSFLPGKGGTPDNNIYKITPALQISALQLY